MFHVILEKIRVEGDLELRVRQRTDQTSGFPYDLLRDVVFLSILRLDRHLGLLPFGLTLDPREGRNEFLGLFVDDDGFVGAVCSWFCLLRMLD